MSRLILLLAAALVCMGGAGCAGPDEAERGSTMGTAREAVLFAYFTGDGQDGMKYALSAPGAAPQIVPSDATAPPAPASNERDFRRLRGGHVWMRSSLGNGLVRDPSIVRGPDGMWHAVWTCGWWDKGFGFAHSPDLVTWSTPERVPVMAGIKGVVNVWAPEIHWDPEREEFLVVWASTVRGMFGATEGSSEDGPDKVGLNHRIWGATTKDFREWSRPRVFFDPGCSVIDATIVRDEPRRRWVMVFKDETLKPVAKKDLKVAFAERMQGEYHAAEQPITAAGTWVEGPTVLQDRDGGDGWTIFFDAYRDGKYGAVETSDWETFRSVEGLVMPRGVRHGCMVRLEPELVRGLLDR